MRRVLYAGAMALAPGALGCDSRIIDLVERMPGADGSSPTEGGPAGGGGAPGSGGNGGNGGSAGAGGFEGGNGLPEGGGPLGEGGFEAGLDAGGARDATSCPPDAATTCRSTVWPNDVSTTNSDRWLVENHDFLTAIRPRVLLLNFYNSFNSTQARERADLQIRALAEGSRYHGYSQPSAQPFLQYQVAKVVDLRDRPPPPNWPNPSSTLVPLTAAGDFDTTALFTQEFGNRFQYPDQSSGRNLTLCEIVDRGLINEVWLMVGEVPRATMNRHPPHIQERKQMYDGAGNTLAGMFDACAGGSPTCLPASIACSRSIRLVHLSPVRGTGCDLDIRGWNVKGMRNAIPYVDTNLRAFLNVDFKTRFGAPFDSFDEICDKNNTPCVNYPSPTAAAGTFNSVSWRINDFLQGCGNPEFPPNARWRYDWGNRGQVQSRCEHFGMRDGDGGQDLPDLYSSDKAAAYDNAFDDSDCGTGWQVYWRQSIPGYANKAFDTEGKPMKNFWPFLFY